MLIPDLSKKAFWDVKFESIDAEKHSRFVMEKVFNYGSWNDQLAIMRYYGLLRIKKEIVDSNYLRNTVVSFLSVLLEIEKKDFKCYNQKQFNPIPWPY